MIKSSARIFLAVFLFSLGLGAGMLYTRQMMAGRISAERLNTARMRMEDWKRFADHIKDDARHRQMHYALFPSDVALSHPTRLSGNGKGGGFQTKVMKVNTLRRGKNESRYSATVVFLNYGHRYLELYVPDIYIEDKKGNRVTAEESTPPFPVFGIPPRVAETFLISYTLPNAATASKLVVTHTGGITTTSIP